MANLMWEWQLLAKFPAFDNRWSDDAKIAWFEMFRRIVALMCGDRKPRRIARIYDIDSR